MFSVSAETVFHARHYLALGNGRREQPHGHDWKVAAVVRAAALDEYGLVLDFHVLTDYLRSAVEPLAQAECINKLPEFDADQPSAERLARYVYRRLAALLPSGLELSEVRLWETPNCYASFCICRPPAD